MKSERRVKYGPQKTLTLAILFSVLTFISVSIGCVLVWSRGSHAGLTSTLDVPITGTYMDFTDVATEYGVNDSHQGQATVWFDYDNDGDLDLLLTVFKGTYTILYRNDEDTFVDVAKEVGLPAIRGSLSVGDYDNDGDIDILCGRLFRNDKNETNTFTEVGSYGDTFVDYDNDGDLDIYQVAFGKSSRLFRNDGEAGFVEIPYALGTDDSRHSRSAAWGDYDNDGDLDLYVVNGVSKAPSRLYRNDVSEGNGFVKTGEMANAGSAMGGSWGDFDGDGDIDYYLVGSYPGYVMTNRLYQNNNSENGNHWLHINAIGTISNRAAIGTTIQVVAGDLTQLRYVESSSGYGSQNSLPVEFGLGTHSTVDSVIIKWPSGRVQNLTDVEVNQFLTVYEDKPGCIRQIPEESTISTNLEELFQLKINQIAFIDSDNLKIKFLNITEDSRCPSDVVCFWEGQATIVVNILKKDQDLGDLSLTSRAGHEDLAVKNFDRYSIKLKKVEPYPKTTQKIELSDYIVTLIVSKI